MLLADVLCRSIADECLSLRSMGKQVRHGADFLRFARSGNIDFSVITLDITAADGQIFLPMETKPATDPPNPADAIPQSDLLSDHLHNVRR
jgi:hypothetical protein